MCSAVCICLHKEIHEKREGKLRSVLLVLLTLNVQMVLRKIRVLRVCNDGSFWGSFFYQSYSKLERLIDECSSHVDPWTENEFSIGDLCLVRTKNGQWKRAKVCSIISSQLLQIELFLIDYGNVIIQPINRIWKLPEKLLAFSGMAQQFFLSKIRPINDINWGDKIMSILKKFISSSIITVDAIVDNNQFVVILLNSEVKLNDYLILHGLAVACKNFGLEEINEMSQSNNVSSNTQKDFCSHESFTSCFINCNEVINPISLTSAHLSSRVVKELRVLGLQRLTTCQSFSFPILNKKRNSVIISPQYTGKTLSYLLPILNCYKNFSKKPLVLILVSCSWQARSIELQIQTLLSYLNLDSQSRCCCSYYSCENEVDFFLLNGVDFFISSPPSCLRVMAKYSSWFTNIECLVLDDMNTLSDNFQLDIQKIIFNIKIYSNFQLIALSSSWLSSLSALPFDPVYIISCSIEVFIKEGLKLAVVPVLVSKLPVMFNLLSSVDCLVICTSNENDAEFLTEVMRVSSLSPVLITEGNVGHLNQYSSSQTFVVADYLLAVLYKHCPLFTHVVHYSPPLTKTVFRQRLSLMFGSIMRGKKCRCSILLDDNWIKQSIFLAELMQRLNLIIPSHLSKMALDQKKMKENDKEWSEVCYHVKAWGQCRLPKCSYKHKFYKLSASKPYCFQLPTDGYIKVKVVHVSNATHLWVYLLEHYPLTRGCSTGYFYDPLQFKKLTLDLAQYYSNKSNIKYHVPGTLYEGIFCGYQSDCGNFFRIQVLKFSNPPGLYFPHKEKARIRIIDVGATKIVDANQLLFLPEKYLEIPSQVLEVYLCGIKPRDDDYDWPCEVVENSRLMLEGRVVFGTIKTSYTNVLWLDLLEQKKPLNDIQVSTLQFNPTEKLLKSSLAILNPEHLQKLKNHFCFSTENLLKPSLS